MRYLSDEWIDALDEVVRNDDGIGKLVGSVDLVLQQIVTGAPDGDITYRVEIDGGAMRVRRGAADDATLRMTTSYETAAAIARGERSARQAFMQGELRVGGDVRVLVEHAEALTTLDDVFASVRERTEW